MVYGLRRRRKYYSVNSRYEGLTLKRIETVKKVKKLCVIAMILEEEAKLTFIRDAMAEDLVILCLTFIEHEIGTVLVENPKFRRSVQLLTDYTDFELYNMRITDRDHIPRILIALQIPAWMYADNRCIIQGEELLLPFLDYFSTIKRQTEFQVRHGMEHSQISRWIKVMFIHIDATLGHKITNNWDYFVPRFESYNDAIRRKYYALHGVRINDRLLFLFINEYPIINFDFKIITFTSIGFVTLPYFSMDHKENIIERKKLLTFRDIKSSIVSGGW